MLPSTNNFAYDEYRSICLKLKALRLWAPDSSLDRNHDKNVASELDMIEPNVRLVSTKLGFVTIFPDFCDAKMWVYDRFCFGPEEAFQRFLFFFCGNQLSRLG